MDSHILSTVHLKDEDGTPLVSGYHSYMVLDTTKLARLLLKPDSNVKSLAHKARPTKYHISYTNAL